MALFFTPQSCIAAPCRELAKRDGAILTVRDRSLAVGYATPRTVPVAITLAKRVVKNPGSPFSSTKTGSISMATVTQTRGSRSQSSVF